MCGAIVWIVLKKTKAQAYQRVIADKGSREVEGANESASTSYYLDVKLDGGGQKRVRVGKKIWEQFAVGDKIVKEAGKYNPTKA